LTTEGANLAGAIDDETGSGALVFGTSPALTTPDIGTPSDGTLTNCDGLPITGIADELLLFGFASSDETTDLTTGEKVATDIPFACVITRIYVSVKTAASGANLQVDVEDEGTTILNSVFSFTTNNAETETFTGSASSYTMSKGDLLSIDVDQIGSTTAGAGLKVYFFGYRT